MLGQINSSQIPEKYTMTPHSCQLFFRNFNQAAFCLHICRIETPDSPNANSFRRPRYISPLFSSVDITKSDNIKLSNRNL